MSIFNKNKEPEKSVGQAVFQGQELIVNPSPEVSLARKKARLHRIKLWLEQYPDHPNRGRILYMQERAKILTAEVAIAEGRVDDITIKGES